MSYESYTRIWKDGKGKTIRPAKSGAEFCFEYEPKANKRYRLFTTGQTAQFYQWKNEPDAHFQYALLTDSLDTEHAVRSQYCLDFSSERPESYVKRIYKKILWKPVLSYLKMNPVPADFTAGFFASAKDLKIDKSRGGYLRMSVEIRHARYGVSRHSNRFPPDKTVVIDFAEGSYDMTEFSAPLTIDPEMTASVAVWIEGREYSGEVYLEKPYLISSTGYDLLPDFSLPVHEKEKFAWLGQNFSRKEWPEFRVSLNGEVVFEGEIFERCHVNSEWELKLPSNKLKKQNILTYELISDYHDPMPYTISEVGIIESDGGDVALVSATDNAKVGASAYILVRTEKDGMTITLDAPSEYLKTEESFYFEEAGLHGIRLECLRAGENIGFTVKSGEAVLDGKIGRIAEGDDDGVITGTGDMVYIFQGLAETEEYLAWYFSNHIGNMITVRPVYRWSGTRVLNPEVWKLFVRLMNECSIKYVIMTDGREPVGLNCNPDDKMLAGENYLGRQSHELDGALFYWGTRNVSKNMTSEQYADMFTRIYDEDGEHCWDRYLAERYVYDLCGEETYMFKDPLVPRFMNVGAIRAVDRLRCHIGSFTRHTGPSVFFKYFLQAGVKWVGAETMYGNMEVLLSFLRGVKKCYGLSSAGVHHATQWSSSPHDAAEHFRRYRLALYVSYMLGADDINTEEGLWRLEEYYSDFHRFTKGCLGHTEQQKDFYRYISTHTRKGSFYTPVAFIHGRYDGWIGFNGRVEKIWGWDNTAGMADGHFGDAERSWSLFDAFYPLAEAGKILYCHDCPTDRPVGFHSGTPKGQVDTIPIEAIGDRELDYKLLAFMGYNYAESRDMTALADYVRGGGRIMLTRAHLTSTTGIDAIRSYRLRYGETPLSFVDGEPRFIENTYNGEAVSVCENFSEDGCEVLVFTDQGLPLVCRYKLGKGDVILFNVNAYPAHEAIKELYREILCKESDALVDQEEIWAEAGDDVEFAVYDTDDGERHIYLLAVDWYRAPELIRRATLRVGAHRYTVELPFGRMIKCVAKGDTAIYPHDEVGEVLSIDDGIARVQGSGKVTFTVCKNGETTMYHIDFDQPVKEIEL